MSILPRCSLSGTRHEAVPFGVICVGPTAGSDPRFVPRCAGHEGRSNRGFSLSAVVSPFVGKSVASQGGLICLMAKEK